MKWNRNIMDQKKSKNSRGYCERKTMGNKDIQKQKQKEDKQQHTTNKLKKKRKEIEKKKKMKKQGH